MAVHSKTNLSNAEKTVYLQHAIKDGSAKNAIEGLSHSGDNYKEAIDCLKSRYDKPCLIQRTHIELILVTPSLREGSGKELRCLHNVVQQHVRALKTLGCDLPGQFITSMIELKLEPIPSSNGRSTLRPKQKFLIISNFLTSLIAGLKPQKPCVSLPRN